MRLSVQESGFFPEGALGGEGTDSGFSNGGTKGFAKVGADFSLFRRPVVGAGSQLNANRRGNVGEAGAASLREMKQ